MCFNTLSIAARSLNGQAAEVIADRQRLVIEPRDRLRDRVLAGAAKARRGDRSQLAGGVILKLNHATERVGDVIYRSWREHPAMPSALIIVAIGLVSDLYQVAVGVEYLSRHEPVVDRSDGYSCAVFVGQGAAITERCRYNLIGCRQRFHKNHAPQVPEPR